MKPRHIVNIFIVVFFVWMLISRYMHVAKLSLKVVDEEGRSIEGVNIELCFYGGCLTKDAIKGATDKNGLFSAVGSSTDGVTGGVAKKEGYYNSVFHQDFFVRRTGMWQPWNKQLKVVLRPIVKPVPMYVRNQHFLNLPTINKEVGYDLSKSDWVAPYGVGQNSDFIFKVKKNYKNYTNFDSKLILSFSNKNDGIQIIKDNRGGDFSVGSVFRLMRNAPENGYNQILIKRSSMGTFGMHDDNSEDNNYIFRIRSEIKNGHLKRAMYGKILGEMTFDVRGTETATIHMHYYLNPDYTQNLEFDPKRNLFTNLPPTEGVALP